jgi:hypothetical protein
LMYRLFNPNKRLHSVLLFLVAYESSQELKDAFSWQQGPTAKLSDIRGRFALGLLTVGHLQSPSVILTTSSHQQKSRMQRVKAPTWITDGKDPPSIPAVSSRDSTAPSTGHSRTNNRAQPRSWPPKEGTPLSMILLLGFPVTLPGSWVTDSH